MSTVRELLQGKGGQIWSIAPNASVYRALELMAEKNIGALLVMEAGKLVGIITERDYARKVILQGRSSKTTAVDELMTPLVYYVEPGHTVEECMALMTSKRIRHLPSAGHGQRRGSWHRQHRRRGQDHHHRAGDHHQAIGAVHHRRRIRPLTEKDGGA